MVPAVAGGILRRPQPSVSPLELCDFVNCLELCVGKTSGLVEDLVIVYIEYFVITVIIIAIVVIIITILTTNNMIVMWEVDVTSTRMPRVTCVCMQTVVSVPG